MNKNYYYPSLLQLQWQDVLMMQMSPQEMETIRFPSQRRQHGDFICSP